MSLFDAGDRMRARAPDPETTGPGSAFRPAPRPRSDDVGGGAPRQRSRAALRLLRGRAGVRHLRGGDAVPPLLLGLVHRDVRAVDQPPDRLPGVLAVDRPD